MPYKAWNLDASAEYYMNSNGAITAAVFYKDIENFIYEAEIDSPFNGITFDEATTFLNGPTGKIFGVELGFSQALTFLPGLLDGFIVQANYTYTDATGDVFADGDPTELREIMLPSSSKHTFNGVLGYEKGPLSLRLAGTYRDKYLDELGGDPVEDRYVEDHFQLDLTARLNVTDKIQLFYNWINITDAEYFAYNTLGGRQNLYQFEQYGWTMKGGVKVTF